MLAAAVLGPLVLYAATLPRTVVLEDDGPFLLAGTHLGVAHPPGYPIYTLIVHLFTRLPFGDPAVLGHLSSAVLGALACGAVYVCARLLGAAAVPALTAAWLFGVSEQFWSQAIIAEVYTLNALLLFAVWALLLHGAGDMRRRWPLVAAAAAWGAGVANHWPLMVLAAPGLALVLLPVWRDVLPRLPRLLGVAFACAALPYAWMVWLSHQAPFISFYGPIESWGEFWFFVSRQGYAGVDVSPSAGWGDRWSFLGWFAADLVRQTTLPGAALAVAGLAVLARRGGSSALAAAGSGVLVVLGNSVALILLLRFDFDVFRVALFRAYPLVCYGVAAVWAAVGMQWLMDRLPAWAARRSARAAGHLRAPRSARGTTAAAALVGAAMVAVSASGGWAANDRSGGDFAARYADMLFDGLPDGAALILHGDAGAPVAYYRYVDGRRPDVSVHNLHGLVLGNRLYEPFAPREEKARTFDRFVGSTDRAVFLDPDADIEPGRRVIRYYGFLQQVMKEGAPDTTQLSRHPRGERYFLELLDRRPADRWERVRRQQLLWQYGHYLGLVVLSDSPVLLEPMRALLDRAHDCRTCLVAMASALLDDDDDAHADRVSAWLTRAGALPHEPLRKAEPARLAYERGRLAELTGDDDEAAAHYRRSHALYPHPDNDAGTALRRLGLLP